MCNQLLILSLVIFNYLHNGVTINDRMQFIDIEYNAFFTDMYCNENTIQHK